MKSVHVSLYRIAQKYMQTGSGYRPYSHSVKKRHQQYWNKLHLLNINKKKCKISYRFGSKFHIETQPRSQGSLLPAHPGNEVDTNYYNVIIN